MHDECIAGGVSGLCQPEGHCSFPSDDCGSGQRYGDHALKLLNYVYAHFHQLAPPRLVPESCDQA